MCHVVFKFSAKKFYTILQRVFFNIVKDLFISFEGWCTIVPLLLGPETEQNIHLAVLQKRIYVVVKFCAQKMLSARFHENFFPNLVKEVQQFF